MKHASPTCLDNLTLLLDEIRQLDGLVERKRGIFYLKGKAFLHFHEDPGGIFADARLDQPDFTRFQINSDEEKQYLMTALRRALQA